MANYIYTALNRVDIFGTQIHLRVYGRKTYKTTIGGIISIAFFAVIASIFVTLSDNMFNRENPRSSVSEIFEPDPSKLEYSRNSPSGFFFMLGLQNRTANHFYDPSIYNLTLFSGDAGEKQVPMEPCTIDHLPEEPELQESFIKAPYSKLENLLCVSKKFESNIVIKGEWSSANFKYFHMTIFPCKNSSGDSAIICKPKEVIEETLASGYFAMYFTDNIIDVMNFKSPAKRIMLNYYIETGLSLRKDITRYLSKSILKTDSGWLTVENSDEEFSVFAKDRESFSAIDPKDKFDKKFVNLLVRRSTSCKVYYRRYLKIQEVFALMGGFLHISKQVLKLIANFFAKKDFHDEITNALFNFSQESEDTDVDSKNKKKKRKINKNWWGRQSNKPDEEQSLNNSPNNNFLPLRKGLWDHIRLKYFSRSNHYKDQRKSALKKIYQQMDLTYLLRKFLEIDKLKHLLLDEDQYNLFEYIAKPVVNNDNSNKSAELKKVKHTGIQNEKDSAIKTKAKLAKASFDNIMKKENFSHIDRKLISLLPYDSDSLEKKSDLSSKGKSTQRLNFSLSSVEVPIEGIDNMMDELTSKYSERQKNTFK